MKKAIFFNYPIGTKKLSLIVTNDSIDSLIESSIIPKQSKFIIENFDENDFSKKLKYMFVESTYFDNYENPNEVLIDFEMITLHFTEKLRNNRNIILSTLDDLQIKAKLRDKDNIVKQIELDKQLLRDFTDQIDISKYKEIDDFIYIIPDIFAIDYQEKYKDLIYGS